MFEFQDRSLLIFLSSCPEFCWAPARPWRPHGSCQPQRSAQGCAHLTRCPVDLQVPTRGWGSTHPGAFTSRNPLPAQKNRAGRAPRGPDNTPPPSARVTAARQTGVMSPCLCHAAAGRPSPGHPASLSPADGQHPRPLRDCPDGDGRCGVRGLAATLGRVGSHRLESARQPAVPCAPFPGPGLRPPRRARTAQGPAPRHSPALPGMEPEHACRLHFLFSSARHR